MNYVLSIQQSHAEPISMLVDVSRDVDQSEMFQEISIEEILKISIIY